MYISRTNIVGSFLIFSFTLMNCASYHTGKGLGLEPGQKPGARIIAQMLKGQNIEGELIAVKHNSLLLLSDEGTDVTIDIKDVRTLIIVKKTQVLKSFGYGAVFGGGGILILGLSGEENDLSILGETFIYEWILPFSLIYGTVGVLIGLVAGLDNRIYVSTKSDSEIQEILRNLRKRARVKNFQ